MIEIIPFESLGRFDNDWLSARYHFSFGEYHDSRRMGFGPLRVWNDDAIQPDTGFPPHGHRDMEIITYVREGAISHEDHLGNKGRTTAGNVQVMSAGTGITHAEYNHEPELTRLFQIWIVPDTKGHPPRWESREFPRMDRAGSLVPLASGRARDRDSGALPIYQDAALFGATLRAGQAVVFLTEPGRRVYLVPARGSLTVDGHTLKARDGAALTAVDRVAIEALEDSELLLADLP